MCDAQKMITSFLVFFFFHSIPLNRVRDILPIHSILSSLKNLFLPLPLFYRKPSNDCVYANEVREIREKSTAVT